MTATLTTLLLAVAMLHETTAASEPSLALSDSDSCPQYDSNKRALIIVDIQNDFISGSLGSPGASNVVGPTNKLRDEGTFDVIAVSMDSHPKGHVSFGSSHGMPMLEDNMHEWGMLHEWKDLNGIDKSQMLWPEHCVYESDGWKNPEGLVLGEQDHWVFKGTDVLRDSYSAFADNDQEWESSLHAHLQSKDVKDLVIVGLVFDVCVKHTALHAIERGYRVYIAEDATVSFGDWMVAAEELKEKGVRIGTVEEYLSNPAGSFNCHASKTTILNESDPVDSNSAPSMPGIASFLLGSFGVFLLHLI